MQPLSKLLEDKALPHVQGLDQERESSAACCCRMLRHLAGGAELQDVGESAGHPTGNVGLLLQEADVLDSPRGELTDLKKLEQDALQRQVALSQLTVSIRDAAALLAAQPSFKAAARLSWLRSQLADLQVGICGVSVTLLELPASWRARSAGRHRGYPAAACHAFALPIDVYTAGSGTVIFSAAPPAGCHALPTDKCPTNLSGSVM